MNVCMKGNYNFVGIKGLSKKTKEKGSERKGKY